MKTLPIACILTLALSACYAQQMKVGEPCEGCEAIYESTIAFEKLKVVDNLPDATLDGKKPLGIYGIVYKADGKTPVENVVLYLYHTDGSRYYPKKGDEKGWAK